MNKTLRNLALVALAAAPFSAFAEIVGDGTAANPYQIATSEDLCEAYKLTKAGEMVYFVQTADIDMAGVDEYVCLVGGDNVTYSSQITYDGRNHVIKNFRPVNGSALDGLHAYCTSIFGVLNGTVKNLGVVDVDILSDQGCGVIAAYAGHSTGTPATVENVYVTGDVGGFGYLGGIFGTSGNDVTVKNCFVNINLDGGANSAAIMGRLRNDMLLENVYAAGTVSEGVGALLVSSDKTDKVVEANWVVAFNTGSDNAVNSVELDGKISVADAANKNDLIVEVKGWPAFSATEEVNGYPALNYALSGAGTEEDPYQISCPEDLCNAYRYVDCGGGDFWFVQTADIDMEGYDDYHALAGYNGAYAAVLHYDGQNHIIKNFVPNTEQGNVADTDYYYCTSIFGVPSGEISNLGVVDAYVYTAQGAGILGAYAGHSTGAPLILENVFVIGEVIGEGGYTGGMFGTTGNVVTMTNCFANVTVEGGAQTAGLIGRLRNDANLERVYTAGTVKGDDPYLVFNTDKAPVCNAYQAVAFNEGSDEVAPADVDMADEEIFVAHGKIAIDVIGEIIEDWEGFSEELYRDYPMLEGFNLGATAIFDATVGEVEADGPAVYYNLQGVQVANPENGVYIVRRGAKVTKELIRK